MCRSALHLRRACNLTKTSTTSSGSSRLERGPTDLHGRSVSKSPCTTWTAADPFGSLKPTFAKASSVSRDTTKPLILVATMSDVTMKKLRENDGEMTIRAGEREVYRSPSSLLGSQESRVHSFAIVDLPPTYSVDLKASQVLISLTYRGCQLRVQFFIAVFYLNVVSRSKVAQSVEAHGNRQRGQNAP